MENAERGATKDNQFDRGPKLSTKSRRRVYRLRSGKAGQKFGPPGRNFYRDSRSLVFTSIERPSDRATERPSDRATERSSDRATERSCGRAIERSSDRSSDRPSDRSSDRATELYQQTHQPKGQAECAERLNNSIETPLIWTRSGQIDTCASFCEFSFCSVKTAKRLKTVNYQVKRISLKVH